MSRFALPGSGALAVQEHGLGHRQRQNWRIQGLNHDLSLAPGPLWLQVPVPGERFR